MCHRLKFKKVQALTGQNKLIRVNKKIYNRRKTLINDKGMTITILHLSLLYYLL